MLRDLRVASSCVLTQAARTEKSRFIHILFRICFTIIIKLSNVRIFRDYNYFIK